jgi:predicted PurR-regulated permease PerM
MRHHKKIIAFFWVLILVFFLSTPARALDGFTQKDRELLITLKVKVEEIDKRFEQIDKRFEQIDKRFEQFGKQIDQLFNFLWIFAVIFTSITVTTIGFAIWDRRSMIRPFETRVKELEEGKIEKVISSLRTLAETDAKLAEVLRRYNLL